MPKRTVFLLLILWLTACVPSQNPEPLKLPVSPLDPDQDSILLDNQWRLTEINLSGGRPNFDSIEPVLLTVQPDLLAVQACNNVSYIIDTRGFEDPRAYRLLPGSSTARECEHGGTEQEAIFSLALQTTNRYEIIDDTLILSGANLFKRRSARLTFVIDNEAKKPEDWQ